MCLNGECFLIGWASCMRFLALVISLKFRVRAPMRLLEGVLGGVGVFKACSAWKS